MNPRLALLACALLALQTAPPKSAPTAGVLHADAFEVVESAPLETTLDHPEIRNADVVWTEMIEHAARTLDFGEFYACSAPGSKLEGVTAALEAASARGVKVELLCADWSKRAGTIEGLQSLEPLENVEVRLTTIPQWSGRYISFARVSHAKYVVIDAQRAWIGSSNWERDYFTNSRNLGVIVEGKQIGSQLDSFFASTWNSAYATRVDPATKYAAPQFDDK